MASANVCDVCGGTIKAAEPRTVLTVTSAVGRQELDIDDLAVEIDVCEACRASQAEAVMQSITSIIAKIRMQPTRKEKR